MGYVPPPVDEFGRVDMEAQQGYYNWLFKLQLLALGAFAIFLLVFVALLNQKGGGDVSALDGEEPVRYDLRGEP